MRAMSVDNMDTLEYQMSQVCLGETQPLDDSVDKPFLHRTSAPPPHKVQVFEVEDETMKEDEIPASQTRDGLDYEPAGVDAYLPHEEPVVMALSDGNLPKEESKVSDGNLPNQEPKEESKVSDGNLPNQEPKEESKVSDGNLPNQEPKEESKVSDGNLPNQEPKEESKVSDGNLPNQEPKEESKVSDGNLPKKDPKVSDGNPPKEDRVDSLHPISPEKAGSFQTSYVQIMFNIVQFSV